MGSFEFARGYSILYVSGPPVGDFGFGGNSIFKVWVFKQNGSVFGYDLFHLHMFGMELGCETDGLWLGGG